MKNGFFNVSTRMMFKKFKKKKNDQEGEKKNGKDEMKVVEFSYEEGQGPKGLIVFQHHILDQFRNHPVMEVAAGMVGSGGFFGVENECVAGFWRSLGSVPPAAGRDGGSGIQKRKIE